MTATVTTLPHYFPEVFAQRVIFSVLMLFASFAVILLLDKFKKIEKKQRNAAFLLSVYVILLLYFTAIGRYSYDDYEFKIHLFFSYGNLLKYADYSSIMQIIINLGMLIPVGFLLPIILKCKRKYLLTLMLSLFLTVLIETLQLIMHCGMFEVDDIFNNFVGAAFGMLIYHFVQKFYIHYRLEKK